MWGKEAEKFFVANKDREFGPRKAKLRYLSFELCHVTRQIDFIPDFNPNTLFGVPRVDDNPHSFIGRVETFEQDFHHLLETLRAPAFLLIRSNSSATQSSTDRARHYSSYYDKPTSRLIERLYGDDFEHLGYDFENESMTTVPCPLTPPPVSQAREVRCARHKCFKIYFLRLRFGAPASVIRLLERYGILRFLRTVAYLQPIIALRRRLN